MDYEKRFEVRWADLDPNWHMRHSAFADYAAQTRVAFLTDRGFTAARFAELGLGPVLFREELLYHRELRANDRFVVDLKLLGGAPDGSRWKLRQRVTREDGVLAATLNLDGAWIDHAKRKLAVPPAELAAAFETLTRDAQWEALPSIGRDKRGA
jgi:acyl-CoA thioester hydrolase